LGQPAAGDLDAVLGIAMTLQEGAVHAVAVVLNFFFNHVYFCGTQETRPPPTHGTHLPVELWVVGICQEPVRGRWDQLRPLTSLRSYTATAGQNPGYETSVRSIKSQHGKIWTS
jgi:hypothetical protein